MEFRVLGPLVVLERGVEIPIRAAKQRALLAMLLLRRGELVSTVALVEGLWGGRPPASAVKTVQVYIANLRTLLGKELIETGPGGYVLRTGPETIDAGRFDELIGHGRDLFGAGKTGVARERLGEALALWRGPPLAEFVSESFVRDEIRRLEELRLVARELLLESELALGRHAEAVLELEALVREQPLRESLRGLLMVALYRSGRQADALAAYRDARSTLLDGLGLDPGESLQQLQTAILNHERALDPPPSSVRTTNLPAPASSFIGRRKEVSAVAALLHDGGGRLVTLTGPGGSGKSRLAIEAAAAAAGNYPDGVFWVGLASMRDPALVMEAIAQTLGATEGPAEQIGNRKLLLLLDNFEQVIDAAAELSALLSACPSLQLLVTSRELLRLQGEVEFPVPPLAGTEAVELFCARSRLAPGEEIAGLCRSLDDLPLAIELAAARTTVLSPAQIRARLSRRLDLFNGGRDLDPRQQTLRATIEWSYELLGEEDKRLFARLAVFTGGCTLDAAEEVTGADINVLQSLVDKSVVRVAGGRFRMLETIGELARERFHASDERTEIERRHVEWFLALAESAEPHLRGAEQSGWLQRLEDDHDNFRRSLAWALERGEGTVALRLAAALWRFWYTRGHVNEARRWLRRALEAGPEEPSEARARALNGAGYLALEQGENDDEALGLLKASLSCAKQVEAKPEAALAAAHICAAQIGRGPRAAAAAGEEAVALAREARDDYVLAIALNNLGEASRALGDTERASAHYAESLELRRRIGDLSRVALSLTNLGEMALLEGAIDRAAHLFAEANEIAAAIGDKRHTCFALEGLAWVAYLEGRWEVARGHARESLRLGQQIGMKLAILDDLLCLAGIAAATGDAPRAARLAAAAEHQHSLISPLPTLADAGFHKASIETAKESCDPDTWDRARAAGQTMTLDEATELALSIT
jgi:predicted ATPase/DNA-binding SARP family transcriptional activator